MTNSIRFADHSDIAFVMDNLADGQTLVALLPETTDVVLLDHRADGLRQMAAFLGSRAPGSLSSIQLLSHGGAAQIDLGAFDLATENLA